MTRYKVMAKMNRMYKILKIVYYKFLELVTLGKGVRVKINGFSLKLPSKYYRLYSSDYESNQFEFIKKRIKKGDVVIDIGAHIGLYAVYFSKLTSGKVFSFEPTPETITVLKKTLEINNCNNVTVIEGAVSCKRSRAIFYTSKTEEIATGNSLIDVETDKNYIREGNYEVELYGIDEFANENKVRVGFLKIDAEGVELDVLNGAENTFIKDRPFASLGLHPFAYKNRGEMLTMIWNKLGEYKMAVQTGGRDISKDEFCNETRGLFDVELVPIEIK